MTSLKMTDIKNENKIYKAKIDVDVNVGGVNHVVKVSPFFKPSKVVEMVDDLINFYKQSAKENIKVEEKYEHDVIGYLMLKHFTDLQFTKSKTAKAINDEFKSIIESPVYKILLEAFAEESIKAVYERIIEVQQASEKIKMEASIMDSSANYLVNKDILLSGLKKNNDASVL